MPQKLTIGFSPCPNDTFVFDALIHGKIPTGRWQFEPVIADVEQLNQLAFESRLDITKLSYHAYAYVNSRYALLRSGSALGSNCGPLLITLPSHRKAGESLSALRQRASEMTVAIPGKYTTANFLFDIAIPKVKAKREMLFSEIEAAVLAGKVDAGLVIHETRFTYADRGLVKLLDLGEHWEQLTGCPIPLGGIAVNRKLAAEVQLEINAFIENSVRHALNHPDSPKAYVRQHAQEMDEEVMYRHIALYVNDFTVKLGSTGEQAVQLLYQTAEERGVIKPLAQPIFIPAAISGTDATASRG